MEFNNKRSVIIGQRLKNYRLKYKESQEAFAERINCAQTTLSKYEKEGITNIDTIMEISEKLGINLLSDSDDDISSKEKILAKIYNFYTGEKDKKIGELILTSEKLKELAFGLNQNILDRILIALRQDGLISIVKNKEDENDTTEFILMTAKGILKTENEKDFPKNLSADIIQEDAIKKEFSKYENGHFLPVKEAAFETVMNKIEEDSIYSPQEFVDAKKYQGEFEDFDNPENNIQLSEHIAVKTDHSKYNGNILLIGEEQKNMIKRNIMNNSSSFVVFDTNDSLIKETGKALKEKGYEIRVLNFVDPEHSNTYNPLIYLKDSQDVCALADRLSSSTETDEDSYNMKIKSLLLQALIFFLIENHDIPKDNQNLTNIWKLLQAAEANGDDPNAQSPLDKLFAHLEGKEPDHIAVKQYKTFKSLVPRGQVSQIAGLCMRDLSTFVLTDIECLTSTDNLDLSSIGDDRVAFFVILPPGNSAYDFIVTILYMQLIRILYSHAISECPRSYYLKNGNEVLAVIYGTADENIENKANRTLLALKRSPIKCSRSRNRYVIKTMEYSKTFNSNQEAMDFKSKLEGASVSIGNTKLPYEVKVILNHSVSKNIFKGLAKHLTYVSKSGINHMISVNGISELRSSFSQDWKIIEENCDIQLFSAVKDTETASYLLNKAGMLNSPSFAGSNKCILFIKHMKPIIDKIFSKKTKPVEEYDYKKEIININKRMHDKIDSGYSGSLSSCTASRQFVDFLKDNDIRTIQDCINNKIVRDYIIKLNTNKVDNE